MIYRLIKFELRGYSWVVGLAFLVGEFLFAMHAPTIATKSLGTWVGSVAFGLLFFPRLVPRRFTLFQAALPIRGRDVFCASVLSGITWTWLMFLAPLAGILVSQNSGRTRITAFVFAGAEILTLAQIAIRCIHSGEISVPEGWRVVVGAATLVSIDVLYALDYTHVPVVFTIGLLAICALGGAALFLKTWGSFPESLEIAPREATTPFRGGKLVVVGFTAYLALLTLDVLFPTHLPVVLTIGVLAILALGGAALFLKPWASFPESLREYRLPSFAWLPIWRASLKLFLPLYVLLLLVDGLLGLESLGPQLFAIFVCWFSIWFSISILRTQHQWMFSLPISRQWMFLAIVLLPLGTLTFGCLVLSEQPAREQIVGLMVVAATSLLPGLLIGTPTFFEQHRLAWVHLKQYGMLFLIVGLVWLVAVAIGSVTMPDETWVAEILPVRLPSLILTAIGAVGTMYWLAYAGFRRMEVRPQQMMPIR